MIPNISSTFPSNIPHQLLFSDEEVAQDWLVLVCGEQQTEKKFHIKYFPQNILTSLYFLSD